jgi:anti-anti-sigma regulatory factor
MVYVCSLWRGDRRGHAVLQGLDAALNWSTTMDLYQHDSATIFRFVLRGELSGRSVEDLEHAWQTAVSTAAGKEFVVDTSGVTGMDATGQELLGRMRERGARVIAARVAKPEVRRISKWAVRLM